MARIAELVYYPVKGLRGVSAAVLTPGRVGVGDEIRVEAWLPEGDDPGAIAHNNR